MLFTFLITGSEASAQPGVIQTDKVNRMRTGPAATTLLAHDRRGAQSDGLAAAWPRRSAPAAGEAASNSILQILSVSHGLPRVAEGVATGAGVRA